MPRETAEGFVDNQFADIDYVKMNESVGNAKARATAAQRWGTDQASKNFGDVHIVDVEGPLFER